jgi:uncharacterized protein DUF4124
MRSSRTCRYGGALLLALSSTFALAATVYRWVDEKGVTQYSDSPPQGVSAEAVEISPGAGPPPPGTDWRKLDEEFMERHRAREKDRDDSIQMHRRQAELEAIQRGAGTPVSGETFAVPDLQRKVLARIVEADHSVAPACTDHSVAGTEALGRDMDQQAVNERWILDRCGEQVRYLVDFGSLDSVQIPPGQHIPASQDQAAPEHEPAPGTIWHAEDEARHMRGDSDSPPFRPRIAELLPRDINMGQRGSRSFVLGADTSFTVRAEKSAE